MPDDRLSDALAEIRTTLEGDAGYRLLEAVEVALSFHEGYDEGHGRTGCSTCLDAYGDRAEFPCDEYKEIRAALTGKETGRA